MTFNLRRLVGAAGIYAVLVFPVSANAQEAEAGQKVRADQARPAWAKELDRLTSAGTGLRAPEGTFPQSGRQHRRGPGPAGIGALIGGAAALGATYAAASRYGDNEGGEFCTRCFVQWSAFAVPVGAAVGAAIGWGIGRSRPSVAAAPVFSRKGTGVVVAASF